MRIQQLTWMAMLVAIDVIGSLFISIFGPAAIVLFFMAGNAVQGSTTTKTGTTDL